MNDDELRAVSANVANMAAAIEIANQAIEAAIREHGRDPDLPLLICAPAGDVALARLEELIEVEPALKEALLSLGIERFIERFDELSLRQKKKAGG